VGEMERSEGRRRFAHFYGDHDRPERSGAVTARQDAMHHCEARLWPLGRPWRSAAATD
jgi:hypothetical protein